MLKSSVISISVLLSLLLFSCNEKSNPETNNKGSISENDLPNDELMKKRYVSKEEFDKLVSQQNKVKLNSKIQKTSYALGQQAGAIYAKDSYDISVEQFMAGFYDGYMKIPNQLSNQEIRELAGRYYNELQELKRIQYEETIKRKVEADNTFPILSKDALESNKRKAEVKTTASGLQYTIKVMGDGKKVTDDNTVAKMEVVLLNVDSSEVIDTYRRGRPIYANNYYFPKGFTEAVNLVGVGGVIDVLIPAELAFGAEGIDTNPQSPIAPAVPANSAVYAQVKVVEIMSIEEAKADGGVFPTKEEVKEIEKNRKNPNPKVPK